MLHLFDNSATIAIASDGISAKYDGKFIKLLSNFDHNFFYTRKAFEDLEIATEKIKVRKVKFVLSNKYCKFISLPWNNSVYSEKDWLLIAQNELKQKLGLEIDKYKISIDLESYNQDVLVCAVEKIAIDFLENIAKVNKWQIETIEPFIITIFNKRLKFFSNKWLAVAEPGHVLVAKIINKRIKKFISILPESGNEKQQVLLNIRRDEIFLGESISDVDKLVAFVAPKLRKYWSDDLNQNKREAKQNNDTSLWMVNLL